MSPSLRTRLFSAVLLLPLLGLAMETSGVGLRCRMTSLVLDACCCGRGGAEAAQPEAVDSVAPAQCCDRVTRDVRHAPAELTAKLRPLSDPPVAAVAVAVATSSLDSAASPAISGADSPESIGPPTVRWRLVTKSSFLI